MLATGVVEATWLPQEAEEDGGLRGEAAVGLRGAWHEFDAAVIGPGMGDTEETRAFVWALLPDLEELARGAVLDADALNAISTMPDATERIPSNIVLTPHPGEMARLLGTTVADIQSRRLEAAREAAARFGCVVVLKGAHSVVATPDGQAALSPYANALLATAGSGDVLAGMIGGYLAQGLEPFNAGCLGVYMHAATGESLREEYGGAGLLASELADRLPRVAREIRA
jgi:NAD(P)H-hydrate epimerase